MAVYMIEFSLLLDISVIQVYQQTDSYNCGIHVIHNAATLSMVSKDNEIKERHILINDYYTVY